MADVGTLRALLTLDKSSFSSGLNSAKGEMSSFGTHSEGVFSKVGSSLGSSIAAGAKVAVAALATVTAAVTLGTKAFMEYEASLADVGRISGANAAELDAFGESILKQSVATGISAVELNKLGASLSSAGVEFKDLEGGVAQASDMMTAYGTNAEKTGGFVGNLMKTWKMAPSAVKEFGSALNVIENSSKATPSYLMDYMGAMGELGALFDVDTSKALAMGGVFADANLQASESATSLKAAVLYALSGPDQKMPTEQLAALKAQYKATGMSAEEASTKAKRVIVQQMGEGNARMSAWAQLLGVSFQDLTDMLNTDFLGTMAKSAAALGKITDNTKRATVADKIWGNYGIKTLATASGAIVNYGDYYQDVMTDIANGSQSMSKEVDRTHATLQNMFDRSKQAVTLFGIEVGKVTSGPLKAFLGWFLDSTPVITTALKQALSGDVFGGLKTMQPVVQEAMNGVMNAISSSVTAIQNILGQIDLNSIIGSLFSSLGSIGPQLVNGIGSALSSIGSLPWESYFSSALSGAESAFAKIGDAIVNQPWESWAGRAAQVLTAAFQTAVTGAIDVGEWIMSKINAVGSGGFQSAGGRFANWLMEGMGVIGSEFKEHWVEWIAGAVTFTGTIGSAVIDFAAGLIGAIGGEVKKRAGEVWANLTYWTSAMGTAYVNLGKNIIDYVGQGIAGGVNAALKPIEDGINGLITKMNEIFKTDISKFSLNIGTGNTQGTSGDAAGAYGNAKTVTAEALRAAWEATYGNGKSSEDIKRESARSALQELGLSGFSGLPMEFMKAAGQKGLSYSESYNLMSDANIGQGKTFAGSAYQVAWNEGKYTGMGGINEQESGLRQESMNQALLFALGLSGTRNTFAYPSGSGAGAGNAWSPTGATGAAAMANLESQWGGGVVPVFVTNWGGGGGAGGIGGNAGGGILPEAVAKKAAEAAKTYAEKSGTLDSLPNMKDFNNMLVEATAEGSDFCNAMSEFGYIQEQVGGIFRDSYIGPTSGWFGAGTTSGITTGGGSAAAEAITKPLEQTAQTIATKQLTTQKQIATKQLGSVTQQTSIAAQRGEAMNDYMDSTWMDCMNAQENATERFVFDMKGAATGGAQLIGTGATKSVYAIDKATGKITVSWANVTDRATAATIASIDAKTIADKTAAIRSQANQAYIDEMWAKTNGGTCAAWDERTARWRTLTQEEYAQASQNRVANQDSAQNVRTMWETGSTTVKNDLTTGGNAIKTATDTMNVAFGPTGDFFKAIGAMESAIGVMTGVGGPWSAAGAGGGGYWAGLAGQNGGGAWVGQGIGATTLNTASPYYASWGGAQASYNAQSASRSAGNYSSSFSMVGGVAKIGKYGEGGMVTKPQIALLGEGGREAVLPNKLVEQIMTGGAGAGSMMAHVSVVVDGKKIADAVGPAIIKRVQQGAGLKVR